MEIKKMRAFSLFVIGFFLGGISSPSIEKLDSEYSTWNTYKNVEYGFEFKYPKNYLMEEKKIPISPHYGIPGACETVFQVSLINPDFKKEIYEPATDEEIEKYGKKPAIEICLREMDCIGRLPITKVCQEIMVTLRNHDLDLYKIKIMLTLLPRSIETTGEIIDSDRCKNELLFINNQYAVKSTFCYNEIIESTTATFYPYTDYIFQMCDAASDYEKIQMFDKIMKTLIIYKKVE